ncbi:MAG: hypothetical protein CM15mP107_4550 [Bacteroidota bacterium]|nr:MAG: hypothetical protein CM15mP107_4550 [Bacteroidota bacterium]
MNRLILFVFIIFTSLELLAQTGTVRGFVYEETSGEPAMFSKCRFRRNQNRRGY